MSKACDSQESPGLSAALMPPWAALEWERTGWTLLMIPTETPSSAAARAARWPASPAPITSTSWVGTGADAIARESRPRSRDSSLCNPSLGGRWGRRGCPPGQQRGGSGRGTPASHASRSDYSQWSARRRMSPRRGDGSVESGEVDVRGQCRWASGSGRAACGRCSCRGRRSRSRRRGLEAVGAVVGAEVGVEPDAELLGDAARRRRALAAGSRASSGSPRRCRASRWVAPSVSRQRKKVLSRGSCGEVALAERLHPLAEGLLGAGREEDHADPLRRVGERSGGRARAGRRPRCRCRWPPGPTCAGRCRPSPRPSRGRGRGRAWRAAGGR